MSDYTRDDATRDYALLLKPLTTAVAASNQNAIVLLEALNRLVAYIKKLELQANLTPEDPGGGPQGGSRRTGRGGAFEKIKKAALPAPPRERAQEKEG